MRLFTRSTIRNIAIGVAAIVGAYAAAGFLLVPLGLKPWLQKRLAWHLQRPVEIQALSVNPFTFTLTAGGVSIRDPEEKRALASAEEIYLNLQTASIYELGLILKEARIRNFEMNLARSRGGVLNLSDLLKGKAAPGAPPGRVSKIINFLEIRRLILLNGRVFFQDRAEDVEHTFRGNSFQIEGVLLDWGKKELSFSSVAALDGNLHSLLLKRDQIPKTSAPPPSAAGGPEKSKWHVALRRVDIDRFAFALENRRTPEPVILKGGKIRVTAKNLTTKENARGTISCSLVFNDKGEISAAGPVTVIPFSTDLKVEAKNVPLLPLQSFAGAPLRISLADGAFSASGALHVQRTKQGEVTAGYKGKASIVNLVSRSSQGKPLLSCKSLVFAGLDLGVNPGHLNIEEVTAQGFAGSLQRLPGGKWDLQEILPAKDAAAENRGGDSAFPVHIDRAVLADGQIRFTDQSLPSPVTWEADRIGIKAEGLTTKENTPGRIAGSFVLNQKGEVSFEGSGTLRPMTWTTALRVKDIPVVSLQPYIQTRIRGDIGGGSLSGDGQFRLAVPPGGRIQASYQGGAVLTGFSFFSEAHREILRWKSAALEGLEADYAPVSLRAAKISLDDFFLRAGVEADGKFNLAQIVKPSRDPSAGKVNAAISVIALQGGKIRFSDRRIRPRYSADLDNVAGRITGLSTAGSEPAGVSVTAKLNGQAPVDINGKMNLFGEDFYVDLSASLRNVQASPFSPYSVKFMGYTINRGQVSLEMKYQIVRKKLEGQNRIQLDNFFLGKEVSPVLQVPVRLVIALLKNREGAIQLDVPVSGDLSNPHFGIANSIFEFLRNLFIRIAASPFKFLGSVFAREGEAELGRVEFSPGSTALNAEAKEKLDILAKALFERPALDLEIQGRADPEKDAGPLKRQVFERSLRIEKQKDLIAQGRPPASPREILIEPGEYEKYVRRIYTSEASPPPGGRPGSAEPVLKDMEESILGRIPVPQGELEELAARRARAVENYIREKGNLKPDRVFLVEPVVAPGKGGQGGSEVDFKLR